MECYYYRSLSGILVPSESVISDIFYAGIWQDYAGCLPSVTWLVEMSRGDACYIVSVLTLWSLRTHQELCENRNEI